MRRVRWFTRPQALAALAGAAVCAAACVVPLRSRSAYTAPLLDGVLSAVPNGIARGFAIDVSEPRLAARVDFYADRPREEGGVQLGSTWATLPFPALNRPCPNGPAPGRRCAVRGDHGFAFAIPPREIWDLGLASGGHRIYAYVVERDGRGSAPLGGSGAVFTLRGIPPDGAIESFRDGVFHGWALDYSAPADAVRVEFYADGLDAQHRLGEARAEEPRKDRGPHGFAFSLPTRMHDYRLHTLYAVGIGRDGTRRELLHSGSARFAFGDGVEVGGVEQRVFDWNHDRCLDHESVRNDPHSDADIPDMPARAFRDAQGQVQLIASSTLGLRNIGPTLDAVHHDCQHVLWRSHYDNRPAAHSDHTYLSALYTEDGQVVHALMHDEFRGVHHDLYNPAAHRLCPDVGHVTRETPEYACWMSTVTYAVSTDGGLTYHQPPNPLVAADPFSYQDLLANIEETSCRGACPERRNGRMGLSETSNIIKLGDAYYAFVHRLGFERAGAPYGSCLMRTRDLGDPTAWRAWRPGARSLDESFSMAFADPERGADPRDALCAPIASDQIGALGTSVTKNRCFPDDRGNPRLLLLGESVERQAALPVPPAGWQHPGEPDRVVHGFYYSLSRRSDDPTQWTPRRLLFEAYMQPEQPAADYPPELDADSPDRLSYIALLDPSDASRNFENSDDNAWIYFTRQHLGRWGLSAGPIHETLRGVDTEVEGAAREPYDRDLVRLPIHFLAEQCPSAAR
jgi:hypothetical protein